MKRVIFLVLIACTFCACYNTNAHSAKVSGNIVNAVGEKVVLQVQSLDSLYSFALDSNGHFEGEIEIEEGLYARIVNNKVVVPIYLEPGTDIELSYDRLDIKKGDFDKVTVTGKNIIETKMLLDFYSKQITHSSQELFVLTPNAFQAIQHETANSNLKIIDDFVAANSSIDKDFVQLFKYQAQLTLAASFFYYPQYHIMMNKADKSIIPDNFNFFIDRLPKNDPNVYTKVYRYNTYEVSVWNSLIMNKVQSLQPDMEKLFNTYFDELMDLKLAQVILDDVANNVIMQYYKNVPDNIKAIFKNRYVKVIKNKRYLNSYKTMMQ